MEGVVEEKSASVPTVAGGHRSVHATDVDADEFPHLLQQYYARLFPYSHYYRWLSYGGGDKKVFQNREFSFTLKDDVYIRYQSFQDQAEMTAAIKKRNPYKIDIGAVFTAKVGTAAKPGQTRAHACQREP